MVSLSESWVVCPMEQKGDIRNYHQVKITTSNIFCTLAGPTLSENMKLLVHLFITSKKKKSFLWQERLFSSVSINGATLNSCISSSWCCKRLKNPSRFPLQTPTFLSVNCAVKFLFQTAWWYTGSMTWRLLLFFFFVKPKRYVSLKSQCCQNGETLPIISKALTSSEAQVLIYRFQWLQHKRQLDKKCGLPKSKRWRTKCFSMQKESKKVTKVSVLSVLQILNKYQSTQLEEITCLMNDFLVPV